MQTQQRSGGRRISGALATALALAAAIPAAAHGSVAFQSPVAYAAEAGTRDVAIGDFDKDGKRDLVTANEIDSSFSILLGNGDGTFQAKVRFAVSAGAPKRVATGDFDGDGNRDIALAISSSNRAAVYWGTGAGTGFDSSSYTVVSTAGIPGGVGAADLGYGYDQLLVTNPSGTQLQVYTGDTVQRVFGAPVNTVVGNGPDAVASGDLYGETDIVTTFPSTGSLRFERSNGAGALLVGQGGSYGLGSPPTNGGNPTDVAIADLTGDGKGDMVTSNLGTNTATILPSRPTNVSAQQNTALPTGSAPTGIATGDFTGDGVADAAVVGSGTNEVTVLRGGAPGVLAPMTIVGSYPAGSGVSRAEAADLNGDGAADLAVSSTDNGGEVHILMSRGTPTLAGQASASVEVGSGLTDTATLAGATPGATGTITFRLYGPGDSTCSSPQVVAPTTVSGNGDYTTSAFTAAHAGTYRWTASYSGDANNDAVASTCSDANQTTVVAKKTTSISVSVTASITVGASATSQVTLAGGVGPSGTIVVRAYAASDCSGSPAYTSDSVIVNANGTSSVTPAFTPPAAGTYRWRATYSGDGDNQTVTSACGASGSTTTVGKKTPTLSASAASPTTVGTTSSVSATLASGYSPAGTITFSAYAASGCASAATWTSTATVSGNGTYAPATAFVPTATGTYRVVASYGGDGNNDTADSACEATGTVVTVDKAEPTLSLDVPSAIALGDDAPAQATLGDVFQSGGTVTFRAYAKAGCTGTPEYTSAAVQVTGNGDFDAAPNFAPDHAGTYRWVADYSGNADNEAASTSCGDPATTTTVAKRAPTLGGAATNATLGDAIEDTATLAGATSDAAGSIVFTAYATAACTGTPAFTSATVTVDGSGDYGSGSYTPPSTGQYRWVATYSGDADNAPAATTCGAAGQVSTVTQARLALDPQSADLGSVTTGQTSAPKTITVTNTSTGVTAEPAKVGTVAASGAGFAVVADGCSGKIVALGASCTFGVTFAPVAAGGAAGAVTVPSNAAGSPATVELSGTATSPPPTATPAPAPAPTVSVTDLTATRCLGTAPGAKRKVTIDYRVSAPSKVTFTLQGRAKQPKPARATCPRSQSPGAPSDFVDVLTTASAARVSAAPSTGRKRPLTTTVSVGAGRHSFALSSLLGSTKLRPGRYRVLVQVVSDQGAKAQNAAYFWVLQPKRAKKRA